MTKMKLGRQGLSLALVAIAGVGFAAENMVPDSGFEKDGEGWRRIDGTTWRVISGEGYGKSKGLVWENDDPGHYSYPVLDVTLEPGRAYHYTALVKVDRLNEKENGKIMVGVEWNKANGQWAGSSYGQVVDDNGMLRDGWVRYEGTTQPMASDVGKAGVLTVLSRGSVGRVRFDNVTFEALEARPVESFVSEAFRDSAVSGMVRFLSVLHLNTATHPLGDYVAEISYMAENGKRAVLPASSLTGDLATFELDVAKLAKGSQVLEMSVRLRSDGKAVGSRKLRFTRLTRPLRRRVTFDAQRRMLLDGKPFFPLGMYTGSPSGEDIEIYAKAPFNFVTQYGTASIGELDAWHRAGILVATDVRKLVYGYNYGAKSPYKTLEESKEAVRKRFAEYGDHPGLIFWYLNDEAPVSLVENIANVQDFLHEVDPERATLTCLCHPETALSFLPTFDVLAHDCYPIGWKKGKEKIEYVWDNMRKSDETMRAMRPLWFIPQAFNWKWYTTEATRRQYGIGEQRMPTRKEMLNMNWQGIAAGANGILMYSFSALRKNLSKEEFGVVWADIVAVAAELKKMERVILADPVAVDASSLPKALVSRAWTLEGRDVYLVVNRTREAARGMLSLPSHVSSLKVFLGSGVMLAKGGAGLAIDLPALGYAFVQVIK